MAREEDLKTSGAWDNIRQKPLDRVSPCKSCLNVNTSTCNSCVGSKDIPMSATGYIPAHGEFAVVEKPLQDKYEELVDKHFELSIKYAELAQKYVEISMRK